VAQKQDPEEVTASTIDPIGWPDPSRPIISERNESIGSDGDWVEGNAPPDVLRAKGRRKGRTNRG
jgi:hypothetical protein